MAGFLCPLDVKRLKKLTETEECLLYEIEVSKQLSKKIKRFNTITIIVYTGLSTSPVIIKGASNATFISGAGLPVGIYFIKWNYPTFFSCNRYYTKIF